MAKFINWQPNPTFKLFDGDQISGLHQLDSNLTINNVSVTASFVYKGQDATATEWSPDQYGELLTIAGTGDDPIINQGTPFVSDIDRSVIWMDRGRRYSSSTGTFANLGTNDFVVEFIFKSRSGVEATGEVFLGKRTSSPAIVWNCQQFSNNAVRLVITEGGVNFILTSSTAVATSSWYHVMMFVNRDEESTDASRVYLNGIEDGTGKDFSALSATAIDIDSGFEIGSAPLSAGMWTTGIAYVSMWNHTDWHQAGAAGPSEWAVIAKERFAKLSGVYPSKAEGTATPESIARTSVAHLDVWNNSTGSLHQVGNSWPRVVKRKDISGSIVVGYLSENSSTNVISSSDDFNASDWSRARLVVTASVAPSPISWLSSSVLSEDDSLASTHFLSNTVTVFSGTKYTASVWAKAANRNWFELKLQPSLTGGTDARTHFDTTLGETGTSENLVDQGIEDWGNGWYRCWMAWTALGNEPEATIGISIAEADDDIVFDGLSQDSLYIAGFQLEEDVLFPSSYIYTNGSPATRTYDKLVYKADDGNVNPLAGTIVLKTLVPDQTDSSSARYVASLTLDSSVDDSILWFLEDTGLSSFQVRSGSSINIPTTTVPDTAIDIGIERYQRLMFTNSTGSLEIDKYATASAAGEFPSSIDSISVGLLTDGSPDNLNGVISSFKIFSGSTRQG